MPIYFYMSEKIKNFEEIDKMSLIPIINLLRFS